MKNSGFNLVPYWRSRGRFIENTNRSCRASRADRSVIIIREELTNHSFASLVGLKLLTTFSGSTRALLTVATPGTGAEEPPKINAGKENAGR